MRRNNNEFITQSYKYNINVYKLLLSATTIALFTYLIAQSRLFIYIIT